MAIGNTWVTFSHLHVLHVHLAYTLYIPPIFPPLKLNSPSPFPLYLCLYVPPLLFLPPSLLFFAPCLSLFPPTFSPTFLPSPLSPFHPTFSPTFFPFSLLSLFPSHFLSFLHPLSLLLTHTWLHSGWDCSSWCSIGSTWEYCWATVGGKHWPRPAR